MRLCLHCQERPPKPSYDWCESCIAWGHEVRRRAEERELARWYQDHKDDPEVWGDDERE